MTVDRTELWLPLLRHLTETFPRWAVVKNAESALGGTGDLDSFAPREDWPAIERAFFEWADAHALSPALVCRHSTGGPNFVTFDDSAHYVQLDVMDRRTYRGSTLIDVDTLLPLSEMDERGFRRIRPGAEGVLKLCMNGSRRNGRPNLQALEQKRVPQLLRADPEGVEAAAQLFGPARGALLGAVDAYLRGGWNRRAVLTVEAWMLLRGARTPAATTHQLWYRELADRRCPIKRLPERRVPADLERWLREEVAPQHEMHGTWAETALVGANKPAAAVTAPTARGQVVVVTGPDGTGKSAVADALATGMLASGLARFHHRPGVLPAKTIHDGPVTEPHKHPPYPRWLSVGKLLYLFCDFLLGWLLRIRPVVRRGGNVIMERGWWDLLVDQRRYRLDVPPLLIRLLGRLLPRPDVTIVLTGAAASLLSRKAELPEPELQRQLDAWRALPAKSLRSVTIDVTQSLPEVVREVEGAIAARAGGRDGWVGLPPGGNPRWLIPTSPPRASANGLLLHQPMSPAALVAWHGARVLARTGALARLPRSAPPHEVIDLVRQHVPPGYILAPGRSNHPSRWTVFVLRPDGGCSLLAKVALDEPGRASLAGEAAATSKLTSFLPAELRSPALVHSADGLLLFDAVCWRPRPRPWRLPVSVARGLGVWFRAAGGTAEGGPAHGDCAPWNLLWDGSSWHLVDWADALDDVEPFADVLHYLVQSSALLGRPNTDELIAGLGGHGWTGAALSAYAEGARLELATARAATQAYLVRSMAAVDHSRREAAPSLRTRRALLGALQGGR